VGRARGAVPTLTALSSDSLGSGGRHRRTTYWRLSATCQTCARARVVCVRRAAGREARAAQDPNRLALRRSARRREVSVTEEHRFCCARGPVQGTRWSTSRYVRDGRRAGQRGKAGGPETAMSG
jgi:hypothetical protein